MNTKNNKRRQHSRAEIERVFVNLLQTRELNQITVSDICKQTNLNRSTFYANYADIYDLADQIRLGLEQEVAFLYENDLFNHCGNDYLRLFQHIAAHPLLYTTYFKLGYDSKFSIPLTQIPSDLHIFPEEHMAYHVEFHRAGLNAIIKKWLQSGCRESPEVMVQIIQTEYLNRGRTAASLPKTTSSAE